MAGSAVFATLPCAFAVLACTGENAPSTGVTGDVPTTVISEEEILGAPAFTLVEDLRIGAADGPPEYQLFRVGDIAVGPDDELYVLDTGNDEVRVFDSAGAYIRTIGRSGEGPGEFQSPLVLAVAGDTVVVTGFRDYHVFTSDGTLLGSERATGNDFPPTVMDLAATTAGWTTLLQPRRATPRPRPGPSQDTTHIARFNVAGVGQTDRSGVSLFGNRIVLVPGPSTYALGQPGFIMTPLFEPIPQVGLSSTGEVYVATGDGYEILVYDPEGTHRATIIGEVERIPATDADLDRMIEIELARYADLPRPLTGESAMVVEMLENEGTSVGHAPYRPVLGSLMVDADGSVLVQRLDLDPNPLESGDDVTWDLLDPERRIVGRIVVSANITPRLLREGMVYARVVDDMGVQSVARFRVEPAADRT